MAISTQPSKVNSIESPAAMLDRTDVVVKEPNTSVTSTFDKLFPP